MLCVLLAGGMLAGCASGPATKDDVCARFGDLGDSVSRANGIFDNAIFRDAGDLADAARRYDGTTDLSADAEALGNIADSDSTSVQEIMRATGTIADLCGHPLGPTGLFGGDK